LSGREIDGSNQQRKEINNRLKHNVWLPLFSVCWLIVSFVTAGWQSIWDWEYLVDRVINLNEFILGRLGCIPTGEEHERHMAPSRSSRKPNSASIHNWQLILGESAWAILSIKKIICYDLINK
jgi:hypothetical protein